MKSIEDYVYLEQGYYQDILKNFEELFLTQLNNVKLLEIDNLVLYATGSSSNAAFAALPFMSNILQIPISIEEPSITENYGLNIKKNTLCIAISQGGHSYSIVKLVEKLQEQGITVFSMTSEKNSPLAEVSQHVLQMGMPVEEMPYVSAGYSVTILDLMLISLLVARSQEKMTNDELKKHINSISAIANSFSELVDRSSEWVDQEIDNFNKARRITFIGYGSAYGVAREGETKFTEAVRISTWGKELEEYMHGPYLGLRPDDFFVFIEPNGRLEQRANLLKKFLINHSNNVYTIFACDSGFITQNTNDLNLNIKTNELLASLFMTVPIHLMAYRLSKRYNIDLEHSAYPDFDKITASKI